GDGARWENRAAALSARQLIRESCARYRLCRTSLQSIISRTRLRISNEEIRGLARLRPLIEKCPAGPGFGSEEGADRARCSRCVYLSPPAGAVHRCSFSSVALDLGESSSGGAAGRARTRPPTTGKE